MLDLERRSGGQKEVTTYASAEKKGAEYFRLKLEFSSTATTK